MIQLAKICMRMDGWNVLCPQRNQGRGEEEAWILQILGEGERDLNYDLGERFSHICLCIPLKRLMSNDPFPYPYMGKY